MVMITQKLKTADREDDRTEIKNLHTKASATVKVNCVQAKNDGLFSYEEIMQLMKIMR